MSLSDVTILITAGNRPGYLYEALQGIQRNLPEVTTVVVNDDGHGHPLALLPKNTIWHEAPKDSYLTTKRNLGVNLIDTKYTVLAADDFAFTSDTRAVIIKMAQHMDALAPHNVDLIGGTYNDKRYEGYLDINQKEGYIRETFLNRDMPASLHTRMGDFWKVDLTINWFIAKTDVLKEVKWNESIGPIGGEHADFFLRLKESWAGVYWTPGLNVYEQKHDESKQDISYRPRRMRFMEGHNKFLEVRGVKRYIGFTESL